MCFLLTVDLLWITSRQQTNRPTVTEQDTLVEPISIELHRAFAPSGPILLSRRSRALRLLFVFIISASAWPSQNAWRIWTGTKLTDPSLPTETLAKASMATNSTCQKNKFGDRMLTGPNRPPGGALKSHRAFAPSTPITSWRMRSLRLLFIFMISTTAWPSQKNAKARKWRCIKPSLPGPEAGLGQSLAQLFGPIAAPNFFDARNLQRSQLLRAQCLRATRLVSSDGILRPGAWSKASSCAAVAWNLLRRKTWSSWSFHWGDVLKLFFSVVNIVFSVYVFFYLQVLRRCTPLFCIVFFLPCLAPVLGWILLPRDQVCSQTLAVRLKVGQGFDESVNFPTWQVMEDHLLACGHLLLENLPLQPHHLGSVTSMGEGWRGHVLLKDLRRLRHFTSKVEVPKPQAITSPSDDLVHGKVASPYGSLHRCPQKITFQVPKRLNFLKFFGNETKTMKLLKRVKLYVT